MGVKKKQMKTKKKEKTEKERFGDIRKELEKQKEAILAEAGVLLGTGLNPGNEALPDLGDQASAEADQNFTLRLREREQKLLKKIEEAIERINEGTFGVCESCGGEISVKRLKARPVTTLCIECKTKQEAEEKIRQ
jgi:DnaK suppressor protein